MAFIVAPLSVCTKWLLIHRRRAAQAIFIKIVFILFQRNILFKPIYQATKLIVKLHEKIAKTCLFYGLLLLTTLTIQN